MARSTSSRVYSLTFSREMVIVIFSTSFPRRFGGLVTFVHHAQLQSKCAPGPCQEYFWRTFWLYHSALGPNAAKHSAIVGRRTLPHEMGDNRYGVFGEAKTEIFFVAEALETKGGAVPAERFLGARKVQVHDTPCPLVELGAFVP